MALDWGQQRTGIATADSEGHVVTARGTFKRAKTAKRWELSTHDIEELRKLIARNEVSGLVLGLPLLREDKDTRSSKGAKKLAKALEEKFSMPVHLIDESFSSFEAQGADDEDAAAAAILLRRFFDERKGRGGFAKLLLMLVLLAGACLAYAYYRFSIQAHAPSKGTYTVDIPPGYSFPKIYPQVGLTGSLDRTLARVWMKLHGTSAKLRVGEFLVRGDMSYSQVLSHLLKGHPIYHSLTVKEGHHIWDVKLTFREKFPLMTDAEFKKLMGSTQALADLKIPQLSKVKSLEGFLFPETYAFQKYQGPQELVNSMLAQFRKRALPILKTHFWADTPEGLYRLLVLASMVEKESSDVEEQPVIASVFWNRLAKKMRLQSDPTTIYPLLPDFDGNLKRLHLEMMNPYNTYRIPELPLGPICNPGETALRAVVRPAESDFLYFVSKNDGTGTHAFSTDYETHSRYVREYQLKKK
jgi:UPF0755 protein